MRLICAGKKPTESTDDSTPGRLRSLGLIMPRIEGMILLAGFVCTALGKLVAVRSHGLPGLSATLVTVMLPDLLFFAGAALLIRCLYMLRPSPFAARCALLMAVIVVLWSVLNTGWLMASGVQLQPGILGLLLYDFKDIWPLAKAHVMNGLSRVILLAAGSLGVFTFFLWCFLKPRKVVARRSRHLPWAIAFVLVIAGVFFARGPCRARIGSSLGAEVLDFSSHWYALVCTATTWRRREYPLQHSRNIHLSGQRQIGAPNVPQSELPNVVVVLLEGVSHKVTSLSGAEKQATPCLKRLAGEGVEFRTTRVPVPYTSKAYWATLTGTTPVIETNEVEAIPVETAYEGLPGILARAGYRTAFFEMSKGNFECAPGFFSNLGFDWAWFRENLEDPSAYIGYLGGDDCRMIKPAFDWVQQGPEPFFLMMITSIGHAPYDVPQWFEESKQEPYEKYMQTIRYTDHFLDQVCMELAANGLDKNTLLCVLGDHGTSFRTEQGKGRWIPYEEVIRIPWVIHWPGHIEPGQIVEWPCSQMDVTPTILNLIGFEITNAAFDGRDALAKTDSTRRLYFSSLLPNSPLGFVEGSRKVVYWPYIDKVFEYDLATDPAEENPIRISAEMTEKIKADVRRWEEKSQIAVDVKKHTKRFLFDHWQVFSTGRSAWAYYVP